jgi:hypothetical protein
LREWAGLPAAEIESLLSAGIVTGDAPTSV